MDHSRAFWDIVERIMPDYEKRREWLKNYGIKMDL
jgi:predicted metal-dependent hydrolase